ncbi:MAG: TolC family protein [Synechococcaceae cyanobacterium]|nr:TolC family protein [Synechococcaceae cyanobacterium]
MLALLLQAGAVVAAALSAQAATAAPGRRPAPALLAPSRSLPPPSGALLRSLELFERDLQRLDQQLSPSGSPPPAPPPELLVAPPTALLPTDPAALTIAREITIALPTALAVAVRNDPELAASRDSVLERQALLGSARGRWWPELAFDLGGSFGQERGFNAVWQDNAGLYPSGSPFLVAADGWNVLQTNLARAAAGFTLGWDLISPARNAAIAEADNELTASRRRWADRLRQLQLDVSLAWYGLQLADQLRRIRSAVVESETVVRDQVRALKQAGLVPRLDLLRSEADLQQARWRLEQAEALSLSRRRQLSNLLNVPFTVTLRAPETVRLQPPWPYDLPETLARGFRSNPQLQALQAARDALLRRADRRAAELLPRLRLVAAAGYGESVATKPLVRLEGCCAATNIRQLYNQSADWAAALQLHWRFFDGGVTAGEVEASRAAARRTDQTLARERNAIRQRLEAAFYDHHAALSQILAARASYAAAREAWRDVRARYQLGLADYSDVSDTITTLTQALESVAESTTLANVSYAQLLRELLPVPDRPGPPPDLTPGLSPDLSLLREPSEPVPQAFAPARRLVAGDPALSAPAPAVSLALPAAAAPAAAPSGATARPGSATAAAAAGP